MGSQSNDRNPTVTQAKKRVTGGSKYRTLMCPVCGRKEKYERELLDIMLVILCNGPNERCRFSIMEKK
jgi:hypothetical protein